MKAFFKSVSLILMKQRLLLFIGLAILLVFAIQQYRLYQTKQYSPASVVEFVSNQVQIEVVYCSPSKKDRVIFGDLVPYGRWWRTGANEPTTIRTSRDLIFNEKDILPAGLYSVITIPNEDHWQLIFNQAVPKWGTEYDATQNTLETTMTVTELPQTVEDFVIDFTEHDNLGEMIMAWDKTKASVMFKVL